MQVMDLERKRRLYRLSIVPRWTVIPTLRTQSVSEHCFNVSWLAVIVTQEWNRKNPGNMIDEKNTLRAVWAAIVHDEAEAISGDIAAPYRRGNTGNGMKFWEERQHYGAFDGGLWSTAIRKIIKIADKLEALTFCHNEIRMGNLTVIEVAEDVRTQLFLAWDTLFGNTDDLPSFISHLLWDLDLSNHPCLKEEYRGR